MDHVRCSWEECKWAEAIHLFRALLEAEQKISIVDFWMSKWSRGTVTISRHADMWWRIATKSDRNIRSTSALYTLSKYEINWLQPSTTNCERSKDDEMMVLLLSSLLVVVPVASFILNECIWANWTNSHLKRQQPFCNLIGVSFWGWAAPMHFRLTKLEYALCDWARVAVIYSQALTHREVCYFNLVKLECRNISIHTVGCVGCVATPVGSNFIYDRRNKVWLALFWSSEGPRMERKNVLPILFVCWVTKGKYELFSNLAYVVDAYCEWHTFEIPPCVWFGWNVYFSSCKWRCSLHSSGRWPHGLVSNACVSEWVSVL